MSYNTQSRIPTALHSTNAKNTKNALVITRLLNLRSSSIMHEYSRSSLTFPAIWGPFCSIYPPEPQALPRLPRSFHFLSRRLLEEGERPASCMKHPAYRADIIPDSKLVSMQCFKRQRVHLTSVIHTAPSN